MSRGTLTPSAPQDTHRTAVELAPETFWSATGLRAALAKLWPRVLPRPS